MSVVSWFQDWRSVRVFVLFFFWSLFLVPGHVVFKDLTLPVVVATHLGVFILPFLYKSIRLNNPLSRFQLFFITPLLISTSLSSKYWRAEYLLQMLVMFVTGFVCACEIAKNFEELRPSLRSLVLFGVTIFFIWCFSELVLVYPELSKYVSLFASISVYALVDAPMDKLSRFEEVDHYRTWKLLAFILGIIVVHVGIFLKGQNHFLFYMVYVLSVINVGFLCRENKKDFVLFSSVIIALSLTPYTPVEMHFDSLVLSCVLVLFYLKSPVLYYKKNKHGVVIVEYDYINNKVLLVNDGVIQGERLLDETSSLKLRYFGGRDTGSIIFNVFNLLQNKKANIAVLGLGAGTMSMFGRNGQNMHFYEINPEVVKVAYNSRFFDYMSNSDAKVKVILGDARNKLMESKDDFYDLVCVDVYQKKSMPDHFLTVEAMQVYLDKMTKDGVILIHTTGSASDEIEGSLAAIAASLKLKGLVAYERHSERTYKSWDKGLLVLPSENSIGVAVVRRLASFLGLKMSLSDSKEETYSWVVLTKSAKNINTLLKEKRWYKLESKRDSKLYTDDAIDYSIYSDLISDGVD